MGQALYRKYRSMSLDDVVGQEHITQALSGALKDGRISHAYLFTGPRGTGKTSIARILAHAINKLPYTPESQHLDIIEIDAASNNGVEDVRDLREKVRLAPTSAKYKVYIIDEVHMLSGAAFNALLKTLEEPPEHAVFILATTEVHKLPATIISRTQRFQFQPIAQDKVAAHLRFIADKEGIKIDDEALAMIAERGEGAFRDSISLLDQLGSVATDTTIDAAAVEATLGIAPKAAMAELISLLQGTSVASVVKAYQALLDSGIAAGTLAGQLMRQLRSEAAKEPSLYTLIDQLIEVPRAYNPTLKLEVVLASYVLRHVRETPTPKAPSGGHKKKVDATQVANNAAAAKLETTQPKAEASNPIAPTIAEDSAQASIPSEAAPSVEEKLGAGVASPKDVPKEHVVLQHLEALTDEAWQSIILATKLAGPTLHTVIRQAIPHFDGEKQLLTLTFRFPLHQKRMEEQRLKQDFFKVLEETIHCRPEMQVVLNRNAVRHISPVKPVEGQSIDESLPADASTATVMSVMGGGEMVNV